MNVGTDTSERACGNAASPERAEEIIARTVGHRSHTGARGPAHAQLYGEAEQRGVHGRWDMSKQQLWRALGK